MTTSNRLGITELAETQSNRSVTVNEAIAKLEAGATCFAAISIGDTAPPGSPAEGDLYVLGASPTGAWSGQGKNVAVYYNAAWFFLPAIEGALAYAQDDNAYYFYSGSAWSLFAGGGGGGVGDVVGPASAVNNNIVLFDTTTGKLIKDSGIAISTDGTLASNSDNKVTTEKGMKTYVDGKVAGLSWKQAVRAATTANGTLASAYENGDTIDGVTLATGDRILIKNQSSGAENGIYVVAASGAPARATDADAGAELVNASVYVSEGTTLADTQWTCSTNAPITVGSTSLAFAQLTSAGGSVPTSRTITAGAGLTGGGDLSADRTFDVGAGTGILANANDVAIDKASAAQVQAATSNKVLTADIIFTAADPVTLTDATTIAVDMATFLNAKVTLGGNRTLGAPSNPKNGQSGCIEIIQDGTGSRTLGYHADWLFAGGTDPTLSTAAGAKDLLFYQVLSTGKTYANLVKAVA
ncbi:DUF2793 domain-containing protein [Mesorhizobium loti]|uniref:DUF2793 domain-containing protein n=1 Tax=Mesorhizobium jarvisii TaxID=1777867 RepID=A0A6M7TH54_9HYPH|nr:MULTISPECIES: DUF2793 domain-containing protein [Mesorhizobium]OBQ58031.1 hypothetical protein A9K72_27895 [Mesorhizobium loti]QKC63143.1 DUF2793 domain-containing protein [Mesorhizobium jarvisii]QKD09054.1 DUF2793 domain-containing protein [Mesorhizobium loti]RJT30150.1 DUF2793 domain-containing protein [Mesorhizobium jarvisii]